MDIRIIAVGRVKEPYIKQGINIYQKSLRAYASVEIVEVIDERAPDNLSLAQIQMVKAKEGQRIEKLIRPYSFVIALAIDGQTLSSPALAKKLKDLRGDGRDKIDFIIGGSLGLDNEILKRAHLLLSFSKLTFPHQLMRLILIEQIDRAIRLLNS